MAHSVDPAALDAGRADPDEGKMSRPRPVLAVICGESTVRAFGHRPTHRVDNQTNLPCLSDCDGAEDWLVVEHAVT
jgi:hypothetical protein